MATHRLTMTPKGYYKTALCVVYVSFEVRGMGKLAGIKNKVHYNTKKFSSDTRDYFRIKLTRDASGQVVAETTTREVMQRRPRVTNDSSFRANMSFRKGDWKSFLAGKDVALVMTSDGRNAEKKAQSEAMKRMARHAAKNILKQRRLQWPIKRVVLKRKVTREPGFDLFGNKKSLKARSIRTKYSIRVFF